eukprot:Plantae.Rhodophyta-Purpureofilum_apyrenoidigerum.ctg9463.p2 GENE.Plantae.Rhodophyta-Purpureofilum_apyrenoidigerum.ctg9463~~Plantae.Rhodophyta-Purpureofilum_apyrenoidigerum.ctg9463.p2  ORF type:complete len:116 (+),score=39.60 Plantae.Rhodophyta-Purpureofilum_apyrenoidigerum.ctg9463:96-443(+)
MESAVAERQLKIQASAVKRLVKEVLYYKEEKFNRERELEKMKAQGAQASDVRHAQNMLAESEGMIPSALERLHASQQILSQSMADANDTSEEARLEVEKVVEEARTVLAKADRTS